MSSPSFTEQWLVGPQSTKFYTRTYSASSPKAALVFIHGFAEHIDRYKDIHPKFAEKGITVFTFDQRGFGRTALDQKEKSKDSLYGKTGWEDQMGDIQWALSHISSLEGVKGLPLFLMGHSMVLFRLYMVPLF
jgi:acylglycerol lipase